MNRQQFNSRNNINDVIILQKSGSTPSFDPAIAYVSGSKRVSWRVNNGSEISQIAGNSIVYTGFTSDTSIRTIEMRGDNFKDISNFTVNSDNLYGGLNLSKIKNLLFFNVSQNPNLTGITHGSSTQIFTQYSANSCKITGNHDLSMFPNLGGTFNMSSNSNLTGVTHTGSTQVISLYNLSQCNIIGNYDLSMFPNLGGNFNMSSNSNLTGVTHTGSTQVFTNYNLTLCNITDNHDLSMFPNLGGIFSLIGNVNLTGITHTGSSQIFTSYNVSGCNIIGNHDLSMFPNLGGSFNMAGNSNLTGVTHTPSPNGFTSYNASNCNLTGDLNVPFSGLATVFNVQNNPNLTGVTLPTISSGFLSFSIAGCNITGNYDFTPLSSFGDSINMGGNTNLTGVTIPNVGTYTTNLGFYNCDLTGVLDLSPLYNLGRSSGLGSAGCNYRIDANTNLTNVILPTSTSFFKNSSNIESNGVFAFYLCDLDYIDFKPLSGATFLTGATNGNPRISLRDNNMSATDVNHILVDFSGNVTYNPTGWSNINLNIGGTNADPDSSSGGYDGLAAIATLTGSPYNWTITY